MTINQKDQNQANSEKKYKKYDISNESDFTIETLASMKEWLIGFWEDDYRESPYTELTEYELEEMIDGIQNSDEMELFNRLGGVGYAFEELDENEEVIKQPKQSKQMHTILCWGYSVITKVVEDTELEITLIRGNEVENAETITISYNNTIEQWKEIHEKNVENLLKEVQNLKKPKCIKVL
jgi:hypothetical protein